MMHDREKSDPAIVAGNRRTNPGDRQRSRWSQGRGPRGTRASKARTGRRDGSACHKRWNAYDKPQGKGRRRSSLRSSTTSASTYSGWRSSRSSAMLIRPPATANSRHPEIVGTASRTARARIWARWLRK
jgi:hypothetical protein